MGWVGLEISLWSDSIEHCFAHWCPEASLSLPKKPFARSGFNIGPFWRKSIFSIFWPISGHIWGSEKLPKGLCRPKMATFGEVCFLNFFAPIALNGTFLNCYFFTQPPIWGFRKALNGMTFTCKVPPWQAREDHSTRALPCTDKLQGSPLDWNIDKSKFCSNIFRSSLSLAKFR